MLPSQHRLTSSRLFSETVRRGRRAGSRTVVAHVLLGPDGGAEAPVRVGLVVGRKVGTAVQRNRVKRRLRHLVRPRLAVLPPGCSVVLRALPSAASSSAANLAHDLDRCLSRLGTPREPASVAS